MRPASQATLLILLVGTILRGTLVFAQAAEEPMEREPTATKRSLKKNSPPNLGQRPLQRAAKKVDSRAEPTSLKIREIQISGYKKIEKDAILRLLLSQEKGSYDPELVRQDVQALFRTGFFYNIVVSKTDSADGVTLKYEVNERPSITEFIFDGNSELSDTDLNEAAGLKPYEVLDTSKIQSAIEKIRKAYEDKGYFLAEVRYRLEDVTANETVRVRFLIEENEKVKVKRISFIGNKHLSSTELKNVMLTKEGGFFSFMSGSGAYKQEAFDQDLRILEYRYFNEGYVQVKFGRPEVTVTPDKKGIYISISVTEGNQFSVGQVDFGGDLLFDKSELFADTKIDDTKIFSWEVLQNDIRTLQAKYGDLGYAYANIIPRTRSRDDEKLMDVLIEIDKGNKVYFGRINVTGNNRTRDKVVRRELQIIEGELYNETKKRDSMAAVRRLGYFEDVQFNSSTPVDQADIMDLDIVVKERNTGSIQVGAGFSTYSGMLFNGSIQQSNLFGRGQNLAVQIDYSKLYQTFSVNFTEPYFMDSKWTLGVEAFKNMRRRLEFLDDKVGGAIRTGYPITPFLRAYLRYGVDNTRVKLDPTWGDPILFPTQTVDGLRSATTATLEYDKRNDRMMPSDGLFASTSVEYAGLGGDIAYTKGLLNLRYYKKVFWEFVFRNNLNFGFISQNGNNAPPFTELFRLGGPYSLRGFQFGSVGERVYSSKVEQNLINDGLDPITAQQYANVVFGGRQQIFYQAEIEFPLVPEAQIKGVMFYDIGDAMNKIELASLRSDVGFGFRWFSPLGPLRFEWGFPLERKKQYNERPVNFEFSIGSSF